VTDLEVVHDGRALLAEGPIWDPRDHSLLWVDILRHEIHRLDAAGDRVVARLRYPVGAVAVRAAGGLVAAAGMGVALVGEETGQAEWIAVLDRGDRMNEAKCDPAGRLWAGTLTNDHRPGASGLYRLDGERRIEAVLEDVTLSNGIGWSPDGETMYYVDTPTEVVDAFDFDPATGAISGRRPLIDLHDVPGRPDGLTVDAEGGIWVAMARGWAVRRFEPGGAPDAVIELPAFKVTSCTFGGPDLGDLYITTACFGLDERELAAQPHAGGVFRCRPGVSGLPANSYAG
jgi:sugar lactone lactonase YvrE